MPKPAETKAPRGEHRVRGDTGEERSGRLVLEREAHRRRRRPDAVEAELDELARRARRQRGEVEHRFGEPLQRPPSPSDDALPGPDRRDRVRRRSRRPIGAAGPRSPARWRGRAGSRDARARCRGRARGTPGRRAPSRCTVAPMSCRKPGSVTSSVRSPPPGRSAASSTTTFQPASASATAATSPFGPEPTTTASTSVAPSMRRRVTQRLDPPARSAPSARSQPRGRSREQWSHPGTPAA